ncbi:hypothetical protein RB195_001032 [Necator americanus]|uniref:G-protein coupled receptors family 1 profile domain-containing protein n=1 Tax=Necator americanus TaxID=51031 RepID=A0ABR1DDP7_NECAM
MSAQTINVYCVAIEALAFNIVGVFGNVQLLWITARRKFTHTKPGILLAINAACHIICLLSELISAIVNFFPPFTRKQCYPYITIYIFVLCQQATLTLVISIDLLLALLIPFWYRTCRTPLYIIVAFSLCSLYSLSVAIWGYMAQNDEVIPFCNPPLGLAPAVSGFWSLSNIIMNSCVVLVYVVIIGFVHFKGKSNAVRGQQKVVRRLQVIVIVFILSWFMALLGVNIASLLKFPPDVRSVWQSNMSNNGFCIPTNNLERGSDMAARLIDFSKPLGSTRTFILLEAMNWHQTDPRKSLLRLETCS